MKIEPFALERWQSTFEHQVAFNLSESGVHPLRLDELIGDPEQMNRLLAQELGYTQTNGTPELRATIAAHYPGASLDHVLVTNGGAEANFLAAWHLLDAGDEVVVMVPNYAQLRGLARASTASVREWWLRETQVDGERRWRGDLDELRELVTPRTKMIAICNPNNPTGARLGTSDLDAICEIAGRYGAWVLSDEIYRGAERDGRETPSAWGRYERVLVTSGLSKGYGLPGLRIGWVVAPPADTDALWSYHDYTTIAPGALSDRLATRALAPPMRDVILARTRAIIGHNYPTVESWISSLDGMLDHIPPEAGAIAWVRYRLPLGSTELATMLRETYSVLIVPGDHFGMDGYLRIGYGSGPEVLEAGLGRIDDLFGALVANATA